MADSLTTEFFEVLVRRLRTPLAPARAAGEELCMTATDPASQRLGAIVLEHLGHMERMIDALRDLSLLERGRLQATRSEIELQSVLEPAVEACRPALEAKSQRLVVRMPDDAPRIQGDEPRLVQIVRNLLDNAVKFTPEGGSVDLSIAVVDSYVEIQLQDSGCGVPPELLPRLFDAFVVAAAAAHPAAGIGIGLSITKHLVDLHHGMISAHCEGPGHGLRCCVRLPLATPGTC